MSQNEPTETPLDHHMAVVGRIVARFISTGLMPQNVDSRAAGKFLGEPVVDKQVFEAAIAWMIDEGLVRAKDRQVFINDGTIRLSAAQLTARGLAIIKHPLPDGGTIEKRIQSDATGRNWSSIGELIGGVAGGFTKSLSS
jgi:hypothetical protein